MTAPDPTFAGAERVQSLAGLEVDIAIIGVPFGWPYPGAQQPSAEAPAAIRARSARYERFRGHYDWDVGGQLFAGRDVRLADVGDVIAHPGDHAGNSARTTAAIRTILGRGAVPFVLGGDDSVPISVLRAYDGQDSFCIVQLDAHIDFRNEVDGVPDGLSSNMRRASEMPWVTGIAQIGLRGTGSARPSDVADAQDWGAVHFTARDVHRDGIDAVLARIPAAERYYIALDIDVLDPSIAPGVLAPAFGGLTYMQVFDLIQGVAMRGQIVGFNVCEVVPLLDVNDLTSSLAARLVMTTISVCAWSGQFGTPR